ncbi:Non-structural maintenance of chromosomes element 4 homolog B [Galdieria sulphuraria]|uniref:Non-structural maintenance of chromosomes element 4 n=1 Tax=Galdieria sulphuraria TaxID=130081 RepID=M2WYN0_GALSU|nr:uncharacterized protein Gasu_33630 [Galdieria sulphuraria]EME29160.1 hypothetical protein Gasu_33630 [Galdieria sulphuraria]GJD11467.1 Non-structural maintenance of chromosomes element 4 homolog B [Galdieria sulphuraria]|eukprot:XP_005705680.1 hypothetical protein Gasu_33630 [Galdieria sulphuraria]
MTGPSLDTGRSLHLTERADLLNEIVEHHKRVDSELGEFEDPDSTLIDKRMTENEQLRTRSTAPQGQVLLSGAFLLFARSAATRAEKISVTHQEFTLEMIIRRLKALNKCSGPSSGSNLNGYGEEQSHYDEDNFENVAIDWKQLGKQLARFYRIPPSVAFVRGPIRAPPKLPRTRSRLEGSAREEKRMRQTDNYLVQRPTLVDPNEGLGQIETDKKVQDMCRAIRAQEESSFFQLVLDKSSYAKTIENIFHLSFLIKDGQVSIAERNGVPWVKYMDPKSSQLESNQSDKPNTSSAPLRTGTTPSQLQFENGQLILSLDYETWEAWKKCL